MTPDAIYLLLGPLTNNVVTCFDTAVRPLFLWLVSIYGLWRFPSQRLNFCNQNNPYLKILEINPYGITCKQIYYIIYVNFTNITNPRCSGNFPYSEISPKMNTRIGQIYSGKKSTSLRVWRSSTCNKRNVTAQETISFPHFSVIVRFHSTF